MVKDSDAKDKVIPMILDLAGDMGKRNSLKVAIGKYAVQNADEQIVSEILNVL